MPTYKVTAPDGHVVSLEGPEGASDAEILEQATKAYTPKKLPVLEAVGRGLNAGLMSNFGDEYAAAANAVLPFGAEETKNIWSGTKFGDAFKNNLARERTLNKRATVERPVTSALSNIAGGVVQTAPLAAGGLTLNAGKLAAGRSAAALAASKAVAPAVGRVAATGAALGGVQGAVSGAGAGDTPENRLRSANAGAVTGAALGGALGGTVAGLAPTVGKYWNAFRGKGAREEALRQTAEALSKEGYDVATPAGKAALAAEISRFGDKPVSLADVTNATRKLAVRGLKTETDIQSPMVDAVERRAAGAGPRLSRDITDTVAPRTDVYKLDDDIVTERDAAFAPLRAAAIETPRAGPVAPGGTLPALRNVVDDVQLQQLARLAQPSIKEARAAAQMERDLLNAQGKDTSHLPDFPNSGEQLDMKSLDYIKRHLDTQVNTQFNSADSSVRAKAQQTKALRDAIRDRMKELSPEYAQSLEVYSEAGDMRRALEEGRDFSKMDPEQIAAAQAKRGAAPQELFRVGVARDLNDTVRTTQDGRPAAGRILNNDLERDQLAAAGVEPGKLQQLEQAVQQERLLDRLRKEAGVPVAQPQGNELQASLPFNPTSPWGWLAAGGRKITGKVSLSRNEKITEQILPRLLEQDKGTISKIIDELVTQGRAEEATKLARAARTKFGARFVGNAVGSPVATTED